ncbi:carcinoembryonic antigen-related cell adhesion molecule 6-like [Clarias gariepinus]|uniref:carcinoembryonic antigen-related cell adhesion molecule 6-like n=1 Tax=Clarias gariepinus TaxID=13013 RepID=UPI00234DF5E0|nr:carcinoembryonic antigen-related cell adhesion molecule 6-like [Clarias gariepinus]
MAASREKKSLKKLHKVLAKGVCFGRELILPERINGTVGGDVLFTPLKIPDPPPTISSWRFNGALIISAQPSGTTVPDTYQGRVILNTFTLALELRILTERDTGQYTLTVQTDKGNITAQTSLQVLVPVSNIAIIPSNTELVEFNSTVSLVCSASGSSPSFIWLNGSSEVTAGERVQLTNSNLTITSVIRDGPENVRVITAPVGPSYSSGSNLKLTCSADSSPAAEFQWAVNGAELGEIGQELKLSNIQSSHSGNYTCMAYNKQSLRYSTSEPISITVLGPVGGNGDSLSAGAIAGIVIGALLGLAGTAGLIFYFMKAKEMPKTKSRGNKQNGATHNSQQQDPHYVNMTGVTMSRTNTQMGHTPQPDDEPIYEN